MKKFYLERSFLFIFMSVMHGAVFGQSGKSDTIGSCEPELKIGLIADPQYCDCDPEGARFYRNTLWKLPRAVDTLNKYGVDFVMSLGDMIDKYYDSYDSVVQFYNNLTMPYYNLLGNHDFEEIDDSLQPGIISRYTMPGYYYDFSYGNWRFVVLDGTELAAYSRYMHPGLAAEGDSLWNSVQSQVNGKPWNGGISRTQLAWIRSRIEDALNSEQQVILFCHFPVFPATLELSLWNSAEIRDLLKEYPNVVAYINGHFHDGAYGFTDGIHYLTQKAMLDTETKNSFAIMEIYRHYISIKGYGNIRDTVLSYRNFPEKTVRLNLSDSIIRFSDHAGSLIGRLTADSQELFSTVDYVMDSSLFQNRFFQINNDSLFLASDSGIQALHQIVTRIMALGCEFDSSFQDFTLVFDSTIAVFSDELRDTVMPVYDTLSVNLGSLVTDYSYSGLQVDASPEDTLVIRSFIAGNRLMIFPLKVGSSAVVLNILDPYTGKELSGSFNVFVTDPLNHPPSHSGSNSHELIIQQNIGLFIFPADLFADEDDDELSFSVRNTDAALFSAVFFSDTLALDGKTGGNAMLKIIADDGRGGTDTLVFNIRVNLPPERMAGTTGIFFHPLDGCLVIGLDSLFSDPDDDTISCTVLSSMVPCSPEPGNILNICPLSAGLSLIYLRIDDSSGGVLLDSLMLSITGLLDDAGIQANNQFRIYPNPGKGIVTIGVESMNAKNMILALLDLSGKKVFLSGLHPLNSGYTEMNIDPGSIVADGRYVAVLYMDGTPVHSQVVVIQR